MVSGQLGQELRDVGFISGVLTGVTRRMDSGRALQNIHFETRIIRYHNLVKMPRCLDCFRDRIGLERGTGFRYHRQICHPRQVANIKLIAKDLGEFPGLVRISCGEKKTMHVDRIYKIYRITF